MTGPSSFGRISSEAYHNRGNAQLGRGRFAEAIKEYDKAIALSPDLAAAIQNRAIAHLQTGAYDKAWADVRAIRKLGRAPIPAFVEDLIKKSGRRGEAEAEGSTTESTEGGRGR